MSPSAEPSTASLVIVGNEVLSAKVQDVNTPFLLERLRALGTPVRAVRIVPDERAMMVEAYRTASAEATWVFSTGGVGPTHDDITMEAVAEAFGQEVVEHPELAAGIRKFFGDRTTPAHLKMARLPANAQVHFEDRLNFPVVQVENIYVFPGAPGLMRDKFLAIQERFRQGDIHLRKLYLLGDEATFAELLEVTEAAHEKLQIGSYPIWGNADHSVVVTVESTCEDTADAAAEAIARGLPAGALVRRV
jgi:molybdenum cofactor synthesis domain-containing protein